MKRAGSAEARIAVALESGYHVNSNTPSEDYLIPLKLTWEQGPLAAQKTVYPKPQQEKYEFSKEPLSVYTGDFTLVTTVAASATAPRGPGVLIGKLRYQACTMKACFPPKSVEVRLPYEIQ